VSKPRTILKRLSLILFGLGLAFAIIEIVMIVFEPYLLQGFYMYDQELGFRVRPHTDGSNEFGFNDDDYPLDKPAGTYRILFLGDSFSFVCGREDNYVAVVRKLIKERFPDRKIDVINAGYPMTHTGEQLAVLKRFGLKYHPDMVVLGFFVGNDFIDGDPYRKRIVLNETFIDIDRREEAVFLGYPILAKSRLIEFVKQKIRILSEDLDRNMAEEARENYARPSQQNEAKPPRQSDARPPQQNEVAAQESGFGPTSQGRPAAAPSSATSAPDLGTTSRKRIRAFVEALAQECREDSSRPTFSRDTYLSLVARKMRICSHDQELREPFAPNIDYILGKIDELTELLSQRGIAFVVGIFPDEYQVDPKLAKAAAKWAGRTAADYDVERSCELLETHLRKRGIRFINLLEALRVAQQVRSTYTPQDTHWNYFGNYVAAHALYLHLVDPLAAHFGGR
jgi:hypothetical protein